MDNDKAEVLRYLGRRDQEVPPELDAMIAECMLLMREAAWPRHVCRTFGIRSGPDGILLENTTVSLRGADISRRLAGCGQVILMAATLGVQADDLIRRWESADLTRSLVLDACATQMIERYCDGIEEQACREESEGESGLAAVPRFSPGYGDLPLDIQPKLLAVLDAGRKIGLTCTDSLILTPRKSVTALIGLGENPSAMCGGCDNCSINKRCRFSKGN